MALFRLLFLGDVVGGAGVRALRDHLGRIRSDRGADLVIANGENAAGGMGITARVAAEMTEAGVDVITTGNHVWCKRELAGQIDRMPRLLRPANYPPGVPGRGWCVVEAGGVQVAVVNLLGRVFMEPMDCPFRTADRVLQELPAPARLVLVDFHAEATSEKRALGLYLDGRVTALVGTHTHVPTADEQLLPGGTGYLTDVGMTGVAHSVIGVQAQAVLGRFLYGMPHRLEVAKGNATIHGVQIDADPVSGKSRAIERFALSDPPPSGFGFDGH